MPVNKLVKLRHRVINDCFQRFSHTGLTLETLINTVNRKLILEDCKPVSKRTIQNDLIELTNNAAPIETKRNGREHLFYYSDPTFSIEKSPITEKDKQTLLDAAQLLQQFDGLPHFNALKETILQINCWVDREHTQPLVQFEENEYQGRTYIADLYKAVKEQRPVVVHYRDFKKKELTFKTMHPYFLKEFRNRWFVVGQMDDSHEIYNYALDRIERLQILEQKPFLPYPDGFSPATYFDDVIGVTLFKENEVETIRFKVSSSFAPYLTTKKLHHSQEEVGEDTDRWKIFELKVRLNNELAGELRRMGKEVEVLAPESLRNAFKEEFEGLMSRYSK